MAELGVSNLTVSAAAAQHPDAVYIGTLARGPVGWAKAPVFRERGDLTAFASLGEPGGPPPVVLMTEPPVDGWAHVRLPIRAQASAPGPVTGWISTDALSLIKADYRIEVLLSRHSVVVTRGGRTIRRMSAAIGATATPTPSVASFVVAINKPIEAQDSNGALGPFTLHLAAWSTALQNNATEGSWDGLVIQGTNCPRTYLQRSITHGSIRVSNDDVTWLARNLPVGTSVRIT